MNEPTAIEALGLTIMALSTVGLGIAVWLGWKARR